VRAALPTRGRFVLLAESFSGPLAIRIAADPPSALVGLILCVTFARNPYPSLAWARPGVDATRDRVVSKAATIRIMRGVRHARRVNVDGPHLLLKTRPQECAGAVLKFIGEVQTAGPAFTGPAIKQSS
jgi:hypothetical protein